MTYVFLMLALLCLLASCSHSKTDAHKYDAERSWGAVSKTMPKGEK
jgi:hypothetical protein